MDSEGGIILFVLGMILAPFIALFYLGRIVVLRVFFPSAPRDRYAPGEIEIYGLGFCIVWAGIAAGIFYYWLE